MSLGISDLFNLRFVLIILEIFIFNYLLFHNSSLISFNLLRL